MRREEMNRERAYEIRPQLDRLHAQLSDAIKDIDYWLTLELTTEEQKYVEQMLVVLSPWRRGVNEVLSGLPLSDAHSHWLEFAEMFLRLYRKASEVRGWAVGEHLGHLADWLSFELAEVNKAGLQPRTHEAHLAAAADKAATKPEPKEPVKSAKLSYDEDTQVLKYPGKSFEGVNEIQFKVIRALYEADTGLSTKNLMKAIDSHSRLENLFQRKGKPLKKFFIDYDPHSKLWRFKPPRNKPRPS